MQKTLILLALLSLVGHATDISVTVNSSEKVTSSFFYFLKSVHDNSIIRRGIFNTAKARDELRSLGLSDNQIQISFAGLKDGEYEFLAFNLPISNHRYIAKKQLVVNPEEAPEKIVSLKKNISSPKLIQIIQANKPYDKIVVLDTIVGPGEFFNSGNLPRNHDGSYYFYPYEGLDYRIRTPETSLSSPQTLYIDTSSTNLISWELKPSFPIKVEFYIRSGTNESKFSALKHLYIKEKEEDLFRVCELQNPGELLLKAGVPNAYIIELPDEIRSLGYFLTETSITVKENNDLANDDSHKIIVSRCPMYSLKVNSLSNEEIPSQVFLTDEFSNRIAIESSQFFLPTAMQEKNLDLWIWNPTKKLYKERFDKALSNHLVILESPIVARVLMNVSSKDFIEDADYELPDPFKFLTTKGAVEEVSKGRVLFNYSQALGGRLRIIMNSGIRIIVSSHHIDSSAESVISLPKTAPVNMTVPENLVGDARVIFEQNGLLTYLTIDRNQIKMEAFVGISKMILLSLSSGKVSYLGDIKVSDADINNLNLEANIPFSDFDLIMKKHPELKLGILGAAGVTVKNGQSFSKKSQ